ncbi:hypothetical protein AWZ03_001452 [Drosophila navojoa]|uniref:Dynein regulatory complex protein 10 n=1 Tax=Drosophila navojoa TaxID=7232 RepID=A0A484BWM4_DRONA|nr:hypothetical protein AWZ03_001452 [Drosophila navojoa]
MDFIREQERNCLEIGKERVTVDLLINKMQECIFQTELELQENEVQLDEMDKLLSRYQANYIDFSKGPEQIPLRPSSYRTFLKLLISADQSTAQCNDLKEELKAYNEEAIVRLESPNLVTRIMDYHLSAITGLEKKLDKLHKLTNQVIKSYNKICRKVKINSLSTKCTRHRAKIMKDKRYNGPRPTTARYKF